MLGTEFIVDSIVNVGRPLFCTARGDDFSSCS